MDDSHEMLSDYVRNGSESAFRGLVTRYLNAVHSTALRLVNGDDHLAKDVTQLVFIHLARKAHTLPPNMMLGGWLHRDTCFVARTIMRGERRRHFREMQAHAMSTQDDYTAANLGQVAPILDEAINQLEPDDRMAILLRFFEQLEYRDVGERIGINEDAARMRIRRALDKLQVLLRHRGVAFSVAALGAALAAGFVSAAPPGLAPRVCGRALDSTAAAGLSATLVKYLTLAKAKIALFSSIVLAALAALIVVHHRGLREVNLPLPQSPSSPGFAFPDDPAPTVPRRSKGFADQPAEIPPSARLVPGNTGGGRSFRNISMAEFAKFVGGVLQAPVADQTGLTGTYDIDMTPPRPGRIDKLLERTRTILRDDLGLQLIEFEGPFTTEEQKFDWAPRIKRHADGTYSEFNFGNYTPRPDGLYTRLPNGIFTNIAPVSDTPTGGFAIKWNHSDAPGLRPTSGKLGPNTGLYDAFTQGIPGDIANKLLSLDQAKLLWALKEGKQDTDTPTWMDIQPYLEPRFGRVQDYTDSSDGDYILGSVDHKALIRLGANAGTARTNGSNIVPAGVGLAPAEQCMTNLRLLDLAKQEWALENRKQETDTPTIEELKPYIHGPDPRCPEGGIYTLGEVEQKPTCNVPGHTIP